MRVSVWTSPQLQSVLVALKGLDKELRKQNRQATRSEALPIWQEEISQHVRTPLDRLVIGNTARVAVSDQNVSLQAARVGRKLTGGLLPRDDWQAVEFGADRDRATTYTVQRNGKQVQVHRRTRRQLPARKPKGRIYYPALEQAVPRILSLWVQTTIRTLGEALHRG